MRITIAERLHPFSHKNGTKFLLPGTSFSVQVFPTRLDFVDLEGRVVPFNVCFDVAGPVRDFTAELDLEHGILRVFGVTRKGYMRYRVSAKKEGVWLILEKGVRSGKEGLLIPCKTNERKREERLSLGMHKAQEWESICRRLDFKEIFPIWIRLGDWTDSQEEGREGNFVLLEKCRQIITNGEKQQVLESFRNLFLSAFDGVLVPRLYDTEYQGILPDAPQFSSISPLPLLTKGAELVRSLFLKEEQGKIGILPCLPPEFHSGRMIGVKTLGGVNVDFEWTKKSLRRMQISSVHSQELVLQLPKSIRSCRVKKRRVIVDKGNLTLSLSVNEKVDLDRFES